MRVFDREFQFQIWPPRWIYRLYEDDNSRLNLRYDFQMSLTPTSDGGANIAAITKRIRSLGRLPWVLAGVRHATPLLSSVNALQGDPDDPVESHLCDFCHKLDLRIESFIVNPLEQQTNKFRYLGRLSSIRHRPYCPFCRLVVAIADRPPDQRSPSHIIEDDPPCYARWVIDGQEDSGDKSPTGEALFRPKTRRILIYSEPQTFKDGYVVLLAGDAPSRNFFGRHIMSSVLDPQVLREWLITCESEHGSDCNESLVDADLLKEPKDVLRAIDVNKMCIVQIPQDSRFVALSYLWGKNFTQLFTTSANLPKLSTPGALSKEKLPRTIKDAIKLTRLLGENYLWTDSLALLHDDGFQYHDDWIYARAALTVVAGSGKDANAGLPGVRKESRVFHQDIEEIHPGLRLMVSHLAEDYISTSQWDSRAWTFQERMLSRRCLLFVNGRIYFQCRRTTFCEDMEMPCTNGWSLDSIDMPTRIFREKPFVQFTSAVELYTRRELTNANDILNAFTGIEQVLEKRLNTTIFFGLFETMMDSSLIWESTKRLIRRPGFPSWTWAGWLGEIQWKFVEEATSWIEWHVEDAEGHDFPPQVRPRISPPIPWQSHRKRVVRKLVDNPNPLLHFDTISTQFTLISPSLIHKSIISPLRKRLTGPSALSTVRPAPADPGLIRAGIADRDGVWCGTIDLDETWMNRVGQSLEFLVMSRVTGFTEDELANWEGTLPDDVEDILAQRNYGVYNVLLVTEHRGMHYREGLGRVLVSSLSKALEPGPCWRNILLS